MKISQLLSILILTCSGSAFADVTCTTLRTAKAVVSVTKSYWEQENGIWVQKNAHLASSSAEEPVFQESSAGCPNPSLLEIDNVMLNGVSQNVRVFGHISIQQASLHPKPNKVFTASYWVSSDKGRTAYASAFTPDLTTKAMGLTFNKERGSSTQTAHEETINVSVYSDDSAGK